MSVSALNPPEPYSAIIFDCDGTLVDSTRLYFRAWNTLFESYGAEMSWDWFAAHLGCSWPLIFEEYQKECGISLGAVLGLQEFNRAYRDGIDTLREIELVADVARRNFGRVPMAVASGGTREIVEATLLAVNLLDLFEAVVTIEDVQGRGKPAPDMFLEAARRLRVPPNECTVFEDSDEGIEAACRAGMSATDVRLVYRPTWRFALSGIAENRCGRPSMSIVMRAMTPNDIPAARMLLSQLGYELDANEVERRYNAVRERGDHAVFVAEEDGRIIGFLHVYERPAFDKPPEVIVQAIVVDQHLRGTGIGKTIMSMAEHWALERGYSSIALKSNISRSGAHSFYNRLGYKIEATSHLFRKQLEGQACKLVRVDKPNADPFQCSMNPPTVRRATVEDAEVLGIIGPAAYAETYGYLWDHPDAYSDQLRTFGVRAFEALLARPEARLWIGEVRGTIVGFLSMIVGSVDPVERRLGGAEIPRIYVIAPAQRTGLGRLLLDAAIEQATTEGLSHVWLDVMASATAARRAHAKWGFREIGGRRFQKLVKVGQSEMVVLLKEVKQSAG